MDAIIIAALIAAGATILTFIFAPIITNKISNNKEILDRQKQHDKEIFGALIKILEKDNFILTVSPKNVGVMGGYRNEIHLTMDILHEFNTNPKTFFLDTNLRKIQKELDNSINKFNHYLAYHSYQNDDRPEWSRVVSSKGRFALYFPEDEFKEIDKTLDEIMDKI